MADEKVIIVTMPSALDVEPFLALYRESSALAAAEAYPKLPADKALKKYEESLLEYLKDPFFTTESGIQALLMDETGNFRSGVRLYPIVGTDGFFIEALETRPDCRHQGWSRMLFSKLCEMLEGEYGPLTMTAAVLKDDEIAINALRASGFTIEKDWFEDSGNRYIKQYTMVYHTPEKE